MVWRTDAARGGHFIRGLKIAKLIHSSERWFAATKYMSSLESGPPRLETIQARLIRCLYLLSSSRANECWYLFGTALQVVTALGLHRKFPVELSKDGCSYFELELRKRIFWSVYTLDKYLTALCSVNPGCSTTKICYPTKLTTRTY